MEGQLSPVYGRFPHQTGMAERSVGGDQGHASNRVLNNVVIGHLPDGISYCVPIYSQCHDHVLVTDEMFLSRARKAVLGQRLEYPLEVILPCKPRSYADE